MADFYAGEHEIMESDAKDRKKKPYSHPTVTKSTLEQAKKFVADRNNCSDQEAADFLELLRRQQQQQSEGKDAPHDAMDEQWKRSA
jgi:hypothetical protein